MATPQQLKDEFLTCIICSEVFKDPVTLHCGHTFCIQCVTSYTKTQRQAIAQEVLPCAHCRQMTKVPNPSRPVDEWASQLKTGFFVKGLVDAIVAAGKETEPAPRAAVRETNVEDVPAVVFDNGSSMFRAGFAGDDAPRVEFPTIVGQKYEKGVYSVYVGDAALSRGESVTLKYPVEHGIVTNWDDMEKIWHHAFYECGANPEEENVFLATSPLSSVKECEKITELMFEKFHVSGIYVCSKGGLPLYRSGRTTGVVLDSGGGATYAASFVEGDVVDSAISTQKSGGNEVEHYLQKLLKDRGYDVLSREAIEDIHNMKHKTVYTAIDAKMEKTIYEGTPLISRTYTKPDGQVIDVGTEVFMCTESMFQPSLLGIQADGVHEMIYKSIMECEEGVQDELFANIVLAGGNTMFLGMPERIEKELKILSPNKRVRVIAPPERNHATWLGGSILASLSTFQDYWQTKEHYQESGCTIVRHF